MKGDKNKMGWNIYDEIVELVSLESTKQNKKIVIRELKDLLNDIENDIEKEVNE